MSIEAMKQAVEALYEAANVLTSRMFVDAAAALREAIEQAEKQEPVAYRWKGELFTPGEIEMLDVTDAVPLYAAPRQWVGLTSREIWACNRTGESDPEFHICMAHQNLVDFALAIEAKLKAKNETT